MVQDDGLVAEKEIDAELNHSANLLPTLDSTLQKAGLSPNDLDCVGVGIGPGSLTGARVGIAFAKGLVLAVGKPLVGVCSLEGIAYRRRECRQTIFVVVDAKMGGFYHVGYRWSAEQIEEVSPLGVCSRADLTKRVPCGALAISPDHEGPPAELAARSAADSRLEPGPVFPSAEYIARRAMREVSGGLYDPKKMVEPIYLRPGVPQKARLPRVGS